MIIDPTPLWRAGRLRFQLHAGQLDMDDHFIEWRKRTSAIRRRKERVPGKFPRVYVANCSRRFGKDHYGVNKAVECALNKAHGQFIYGTAYKTDINAIVKPLFEKVLETCPTYLKPVFRQNYLSEGVSAFEFPNDAVIKLVGVDQDPDKLRGRGLNAAWLSEASYIKNLSKIIKSVLMPQLQGDLDAFIMLNSTPCEDISHPYITEMMPDAEARDAYFERTIEDNPLLSEAEREEFIEAAGGRDDPDCQREYFVQIVRDQSVVMIPEFDEVIHTGSLQKPPYAFGYTIIDPGYSDFCAILCMYWDPYLEKLCVFNDHAEPGMNTLMIVQKIKELEAVAFKDLVYFRNNQLHNNPIHRYSDTDSRLIADLQTEHGMKISPVRKDSSFAAWLDLRGGFKKNQILIGTAAKKTAIHTKLGVKGPQGEPARKKGFGHFDALVALKYGWRMIDRKGSPIPPHTYEMMRRNGSKNLQYRKGSQTANAVLDLLPNGPRHSKHRRKAGRLYA